MLLNQTTGRQVGRVLSNFFQLCPNANAALEVATEDIEEVIHSLGLHKKRALRIQQFSQEYLKESCTHVFELTGVGKTRWRRIGAYLGEIRVILFRVPLLVEAQKIIR